MTFASVPATITTLGESAFRQCTNLPATMDFSGTDLETMDNYVFENCTSIEKFIFPDNPLIITIPNGFFAGCTKLEDIVLPTDITTIGSYVFSNTGFVNLDLASYTSLNTIIG